MKILRYVIYIPVSLVLFFVLSYIIPWVLYYVWKIFYVICFAGTRFDMPPLFKYEKALYDFKSFLMTECLGWIIAAFLAGLAGGIIIPKNDKKAITYIVTAIPFASCMAFIGYLIWNTEHWFYSSVTELALFIAFICYLGGFSSWREEDF